MTLSTLCRSQVQFLGNKSYMTLIFSHPSWCEFMKGNTVVCDTTVIIRCGTDCLMLQEEGLSHWDNAVLHQCLSATRLAINIVKHTKHRLTIQ